MSEYRELAEKLAGLSRLAASLNAEASAGTTGQSVSKPVVDLAPRIEAAEIRLHKVEQWVRDMDARMNQLSIKFDQLNKADQALGLRLSGFEGAMKDWDDKVGEVVSRATPAVLSAVMKSVNEKFSARLGSIVASYTDLHERIEQCRFRAGLVDDDTEFKSAPMSKAAKRRAKDPRMTRRFALRERILHYLRTERSPASVEKMRLALGALPKAMGDAVDFMLRHGLVEHSDRRRRKDPMIRIGTK